MKTNTHSHETICNQLVAPTTGRSFALRKGPPEKAKHTFGLTKQSPRFLPSSPLGLLRLAPGAWHCRRQESGSEPTAGCFLSLLVAECKKGQLHQAEAILEDHGFGVGCVRVSTPKLPGPMGRVVS